MTTSTQLRLKKSIVRGMGTLSPFGFGVHHLWQASQLGQSKTTLGFSSISEEIHNTALEYLTSHKRFIRVPKSKQITILKSRPMIWALSTIWQAMDDAGWEQMKTNDGFILATTTGELPLWEAEVLDYYRGKSGLGSHSYRPLSDMLFELRTVLEQDGPFLLITSACTASTQALGIAQAWIESEKVKRCLVGGVEKLCDLTMSGFKSLNLISEDSCRPFDAHRKGINLSEAAAFFCISADDPQNKVSNEPTRAAILGGGFSCDAGPMTAPDSEGNGCFRAMSQAIDRSGIQPDQIDWVHAHGTGSQLNDIAEASALSRLGLNSEAVVSSTKFVHGHSLGASGALETILCVKAIEDQICIPTWGTTEVDPKISAPILTEIKNKPVNHVLKNTLGFGGINGSIVLSSPEALS